MIDFERFPLPWTPKRSWEDFCDFDEDEDECDEYMAQPFVRIDAANGASVASAHDLFTFPEGVAELMALAPRLLEALEEWIAFAERNFTEEEISWLAAHRALVARIKGVA